MSDVQGGAAQDAAPTEQAGLDAFRIALPNFEGPLDLLLHLIKEHKLDIFDIPVALITRKYNEYLSKMKELNLDIAGEFLVMASTLAHIKSRLLLPRQEQPQTEDPQAEDAGDPRAELVKRLLEYQKYKEAGEHLGRQDILHRDVFPRRVAHESLPIPEEEVGLVEISVYKLIEALDRVLKNAEPELQHEVVRERLSLSDAISRIGERLAREGEVTFFSLFEEQRTRQQIVVTFLAMLEMVKLKLVRIFQEAGEEEILLRPGKGVLTHTEAPEVDESEYR